jgi:hypothetical protein
MLTGSVFDKNIRKGSGQLPLQHNFDRQLKICDAIIWYAWYSGGLICKLRGHYGKE